MNGHEPPVSRREFGEVRCIVVKVGSGVIAGKGRLHPKIISLLAHDVTTLQRAGHDVVMVVSGAVAAGFHPLGMSQCPAAVVERQAAASIGQHRLMAAFCNAFKRQRVHVAQLLMSSEDIENRRRFLSARHTLQALLSRGIIPIVNENDALSDDEVKVGDNDHLAAMMTSVVSADLLIILSSVRGLYRNGDGSVIPQVDLGVSLDKHIKPMMSESGAGGMAAKVSAARLASRWSVPTVIAEGTKPGMLSRILAGEPIGTLFVPHHRKLSSRKRWIAIRPRSRGELVVDEGAKHAILRKGASLLPSGIIGVEGRFPIGSRVDVQDDHGAVFAVGLVSYPADEIRRVCGKRASEIKKVLGYEYVKAIIHRDDMVILGGEDR